MPISAEALSKIINHNSSTLCTPKGDKMLNEFKGVNNGGTDIDPNSYSDEWDNWNYDEPVNLMSTPSQRMPQGIRESMSQNPVQQYSPSSAMLGMMTEDSQKQMMLEQQYAAMQQQQRQQQNGVNYNMIKSIVKECLNEYFSKQPLNEGATLKQIGLSEGKIKLVDNKGNIFSAMLELTGNIKDKKK